MTYLYLLSLLTLVAYIGYALKVCGLPASLSDTCYILKEKHHPSWLFQFAMVVCPMYLVPVWLELSCSVSLFLGLWRADVCRYSAFVQGGVSEEGSLRWDYSSRIGHYLVAAVLWHVVYPFHFLLCVRHCHAVQEEVAVLAGNGFVCECLYWIVGKMLFG